MKSFHVKEFNVKFLAPSNHDQISHDEQHFVLREFTTSQMLFHGNLQELGMNGDQCEKSISLKITNITEADLRQKSE